MTGGQAVAKDPKATVISFDRDRISKKFRRALIVDDEEGYAHSVRQNLEYIGFEADVVNSLDAAAQRLFEQPYPFIICDNIFIDRARQRGSEFIRDHDELFGEGKIILMTGFPERHIVDADILKGRGVDIIKKGVGSFDRLKHLCDQIVDTKVDEFTRKLSSVCDSLIENVEDQTDLETLFSDSYLYKKGRSYLLGYLKKFPNADQVQFVVSGSSYSPNSLIKAIEEGKDVSRELIDQLLDDALE